MNYNCFLDQKYISIYIINILLNITELLHSEFLAECVCAWVLAFIVSHFLPVIVIPVEDRRVLYAKNVTVGRNGTNCALCERTLHLGDAGVPDERFTFYTKNTIFKYTGASCDKALDFLQIKNGFAQMTAKFNSSLENCLMNLEKKIRDLTLEQHNRGVQAISETRAELSQYNEPIGANIAGVRNDMSAGQLAMQQDLD